MELFIYVAAKYRLTSPMTLKFIIRTISRTYLQYNYVTYKQEISTKQEMIIIHWAMAKTSEKHAQHGSHGEWRCRRHQSRTRNVPYQSRSITRLTIP